MTAKSVDFRVKSWGHNYTVLKQKGLNVELMVWTSPGLRSGDILILNGEKGPIYVEVAEARWMVNVDDMYKVLAFRITPDAYLKFHDKEQLKKKRHRQKRAVKDLMKTMGVNYTTALREYERLEKDAASSE